MTGRVEGVFIAAKGAELPRAVEGATAVPGRGLEGDRYFEAAGTFSQQEGTGRDLTLIESEALGGLLEQTGIALGPAAARRNVLTAGVSLNELVGKRFLVGEVECIGRRLCDPCDHLQKLTEPGVLRGLVDRGGLRADIVGGGRIAVGDELQELSG